MNVEKLVQKFEDCPYNCTNGKLMDRRLKKYIPCPYCSQKKKELANKGMAETIEGNVDLLSSILGVQNDYMKAIFSYDACVPDGERLYIDKDSIERQKTMSEEVYLGLTVGQCPDRSYCFGLGNKGRVDRFVYPLLAKAYLSGLTVSKFISCTDYNRLLVNMSYELDDLYSNDVVIMLICDGSSKADIAAAKGLMQSRALRGKSTIFVTTWSIEACSILLGFWNDPSLFMATAVFLEYRSSGKNKHSHYINQLTGVENGTIEVSDDNEDKYEGGYKDSYEKETQGTRHGISMKELASL